MKYTHEEKLEIGRRLYQKEISYLDASHEYGIALSTVGNYYRLYKRENHLPDASRSAVTVPVGKMSAIPEDMDLERLQSMSKEELIREVVQSKINEARLKKGYEVKGDGTVILYDSRNIR